MNKTYGRLIVAATLVAWLVAPVDARAQGRPAGFGGGAGAGRPTVSPFLSMGQGGGAFNYFNIVRPELELRNIINRQAGQLQQLEQRNKELPKTDAAMLKQEEFTLPRTGHRSYFSNVSHYYGLWR